MKVISFITLMFFGPTIFAQDNTPSTFAILRTDYRESTYKVYLENGRIENLVDTLKVTQYLDKVGPVASKAEGDRILFKCLEYMEAKGYELITFSIFPTDVTLTGTVSYLTQNKNFYREYIFRKRRN
jgi:hypothetical protein